MKAGTASRLAWSLVGVSAALSMGGLALTSILGEGEGRVSGPALPLALALLLSFPVVGALIAARKPTNSIGWLLLGGGLANAILVTTSEYGQVGLDRVPALPGSVLAGWLGDVFWLPSLALTTTLLFLLFPNGHLASRRWRPVLVVVIAASALTTISVAFERTLYTNPRVEAPLAGVGVPPVITDTAGGIAIVTLLLVTVASVGGLVLRLRRSRGAERQQLKWFVFAAVLVLLVELPLNLQESPSETLEMISGVVLLAIPGSIGVAILRHRLLDIDVVISRTVVFGILAAGITVVYLGIVVGVGALVGGRADPLLSIAATALIALGFQPLRERARRFANRLAYGKRATPYEVLSTFSDSLGEAYSADDILPRIARMIGQATGAERASVWVRLGDRLLPSATWPEPAARPSPVGFDGMDLPAFPDDERAFAVRHQGELLGALSVRTSRREALDVTQERLLADLAGQAGLLLRNVRLIEELRASRQRLVAAQDAERRRLERNIHDGAQQQLVALAVKLRLLGSVAEKDSPKARDLAEELRGEAQAALEELRDLARGIYPPLLADRGLSEALRAQARKSAIPVSVESDGVGRYSEEVEAGVYFCVLEALQNVAKHGDASRVSVRLRWEDHSLAFAVEDDGRGFDPDTTARGSGLQNMADRLAALGGSVEIVSAPGRGTTVTGAIPTTEPGR